MPDRLKNLVHAVERTRGVPGDMAELGVYKGGSGKVIATVRLEVTLHLFDTWEGLPYKEEFQFDTHGYLNKGDFASPMDAVERYLEGLNVKFWPHFPMNDYAYRFDGELSFAHLFRRLRLQVHRGYAGG